MPLLFQGGGREGRFEMELWKAFKEGLKVLKNISAQWTSLIAA